MAKSVRTKSQVKDYCTYDQDTGVFTANYGSQDNFFKKGRRIGYPINGFTQIRIHGKNYYAHNLAWLYIHGYIPTGVVHIEHSDKNKANNALNNLDIVETTQRNESLAGIRAIDTKSHIGIVYDWDRDKWQSFLQIHGNTINGVKIKAKTKHLGYFPSRIEAVATSKKARHDFTVKMRGY